MKTSLVYSSITLFLLSLSACGGKGSFYSSGGPSDPFNPETQAGPGPGLDDGNDQLKKTKWITLSSTDLFSGQDKQTLDWLFVIDNSGSMSQELASVKAQLGNFVTQLQARRIVHYRAAVTTTNYLAHNSSGKHLTESSAGIKMVDSLVDPDPVASFLSILNSVTINELKSGYEMGLLAMEEAIKLEGSQFMRAGTDLVVITLSDEDDHSDRDCVTNPNDASCTRNDSVCLPGQLNCPYFPAQETATFLQGLNRAVLYYPLIGLPQNQTSASPTCSVAATAGHRYTSVASLLGFPAMDICTNVPAGSSMSSLEQSFLNIANTISERGMCFTLANKAYGTNMEVSVTTNGVEEIVPQSATNGWTFDAATSAVCFPGSFVVDSTSQIRVKYDYQKEVPAE